MPSQSTDLQTEAASFQLTHRCMNETYLLVKLLSFEVVYYAMQHHFSTSRLIKALKAGDMRHKSKYRDFNLPKFTVC